MCFFYGVFFCFMLCCVRLSHCIKEPAAAAAALLYMHFVELKWGPKERPRTALLSHSSAAITCSAAC